MTLFVQITNATPAKPGAWREFAKCADQHETAKLALDRHLRESGYMRHVVQIGGTVTLFSVFVFEKGTLLHPGPMHPAGPVRQFDFSVRLSVGAIAAAA